MPAAPDRPAPPDSLLLLFETTHAAMEAEEQIINGGFWCEVVPRPPEVATAQCGLAIEINTADREDVSGILAKAGIEFEPYSQKGESDA